MTRACKIKNDKARIHFPIHKALLRVILKGVKEKFIGHNVIQQPYLDTLFRAIFTTTYFGLLRVSEIADGSHPILPKDVHIASNKNKVLFMLHTSKTHGKGDKLQTVKIQAETGNKKIKDMTTCPFTILKQYINQRKPYASDSEPFFVYKDRTPVTANHLRNTLKRILSTMGYDERVYNFHSFCIGRSQDLWKMGVPVEIIKKLGKWSGKSSSIYKYLR